MKTRHGRAHLAFLLLIAVLLCQPACSDAASSVSDDPEGTTSGATDPGEGATTDAATTAPTGDAATDPPDDDTSESMPDVVDTTGDAANPSDPEDALEDAGPTAQDVGTSDVTAADGQVEQDDSAGDAATTDASSAEDVAPAPEDADEPTDTLVEGPGDAFTNDDTTTNDDVSASDDADIVPEPEPEPEPELPPVVAFSAPAAMASFDEGLPITFLAMVVAGDAALETLTWTLTSSVDGLMGSGSVSPEGVVELVTSTLSPGPHVVTLNVDTPTLPQAAEATMTLKICAVMTPDDFDADIEASGWKLYGNAYWDAGGWLELTGLGSGGGSIYKVSETLSASDTTILFDFYTGDGINGGADGFAMTVIDVDNVADLETFIDTAKNGGCLGYGASAACGPMEIEAFHVEIDTWYNDNYADPTTNHIAITLNGDPSNHVLVADGLILEDSQWHTIEIAVAGTNVNVNLDGINLINGDIPGLTFRGGYIGFSGSTGWATNWHRVDNLTVVQECANL